MKREIEFFATSQEIELLVPEPKPAKQYLPNWYKDIFPVTYKSLKFDSGGNIQTNLKNCIPFLDIMTGGYIQETWADIEIKEKDGYIEYFSAGVPVNTVPAIMSHRPKASVPVGEEFYPFEFVWHQAWAPKLPKGYSYLLSHPFNRIDLPFYTIGGIVDADSFTNSSGGNLPFYIKKGFSGLIPAGTPIFQIIPFKREDWKSKIIKFNQEKIKKTNYELRRFFVGGYKKKYWSKKTFE
jgi:hypothetical protein